jgi:hypothetical protein
MIAPSYLKEVSDVRAAIWLAVFMLAVTSARAERVEPVW